MSLPFRYLLLLLVSCCIPSFARAEEIEVRQGTVSIKVPVLEGFVSLTPETKEFKDFYANNVSNGGKVFAVLVPPGSLPAPRQLDVGTTKNVEGRDFTKEDLDVVRKSTEKNPDQLLETAKKKSGLERLVIESPHDSSERHYSFIVRNREGEGQETCAAVTFAVVRGRFWVFSVRSSVNTEPEEEAWLKSTAKLWVTSIFTANPSDAAAQAIENRIQTKKAESESGLPEHLADISCSVAGALLILFFTVGLKKRKKASQIPPQSEA
jgi:hypothetical protein